MTLRCCVLVAALLLPPATACAQTTGYVVERDGQTIGAQRISLSTDGDAVTATGKTDVAVTLFGFVLYRYSERWRETWRGDAFVRYDGTVDDDGDVSRLTLQQTSDGIVLTDGATRRRLPGDAIPETYWRKETLEAAHLIDPQTGALIVVSTDPAPDAAPEIPGLHTYRMTGDQDRTLWYDADGNWAGMTLTARDGSQVTVRREDLGL